MCPNVFGAGIAIALGIGGAADTEGIENEEESACHRMGRVACLRSQT